MSIPAGYFLCKQTFEFFLRPKKIKTWIDACLPPTLLRHELIVFQPSSAFPRKHRYENFFIELAATIADILD